LLFHVAQSGRNNALDVVKELVESYKADINLVDNEGLTPLMYACYNQHDYAALPVIEYLHEKGASLDLVDKKGRNCIFIATGFAGTRGEVAKWLISKRPESVHHVDKDGNSLLLLAATGKDPEVMEWVLSLKNDAGEALFDVNRPDKDGLTPLMKVCGFGASEDTIDTAKSLVNAGAQGDIVSPDGKTLAHIICGFGSGQENLLRLACRQLGVSTTGRDKHQMTPLHYACGFSCGWDECIEFLLDWDADVNAVDDKLKTPLHYAAQHFATYRRRGPKVMKMLLKAKAKLDLKDADGKTALEIALESENDEAADILRAAGAQ
jgi:ankyrin repeat protein